MKLQLWTVNPVTIQYGNRPQLHSTYVDETPKSYKLDGRTEAFGYARMLNKDLLDKPHPCATFCGPVSRTPEGAVKLWRELVRNQRAALQDEIEKLDQTLLCEPQLVEEDPTSEAEDVVQFVKKLAKDKKT